MTGPSASPARIREVIAETLWRNLHPDDLPGLCEALGLDPCGPHETPWASKRRYVLRRLVPLSADRLVEVAVAVGERFEDPELSELLSPPGLRGPDGDLRNLIFAARGPKPRLVLRDAVSNIIEIVEHADSCLVYDRPLDGGGLSWGDLVSWWSDTAPAAGANPARSLYARLQASLDSPVEKVLFRAYAARYGGAEGAATPAMIPQVYLHYDPYTLRELAPRGGGTLKRQRMDFLLLLADRSRVVIEVDGKQHYADGDRADPSRYAEMVGEDRRLRLAGYDVYRFGGAELSPDDPDAPSRVSGFFDALLARHTA